MAERIELTYEQLVADVSGEGFGHGADFVAVKMMQAKEERMAVEGDTARKEVVDIESVTLETPKRTISEVTVYLASEAIDPVAPAEPKEHLFELTE